jgi:hypothetical protein
MTRLLAAFAALALATPSALAASQGPGPVSIDSDRVQAQSAADIVSADETFVALQQNRVIALKNMWDDAVKAGHPNEAGRLAIEHFKALQIEMRGRIALQHARRDFSVARERLISDEYTVQQG